MYNCFPFLYIHQFSLFLSFVAVCTRTSKESLWRAQRQSDCRSDLSAALGRQAAPTVGCWSRSRAGDAAARGQRRARSARRSRLRSAHGAARTTAGRSARRHDQGTRRRAVVDVAHCRAARPARRAAARIVCRRCVATCA